MKTCTLLAAVATTTFVAGTTQAASFVTDFQATIGSEQNANATSEGGPYHVSVNPNNPGYAAVAADLPNSGDPAPNFERDWSDPVQAWTWVGGGPNNVLTQNVRTDGSGKVSFTTTSTSFDGFGQNQLQLWTTTDPGSDLTNPAAGPDQTGPGYRGSFVQATGTVDVSGLASGSVTVFYGDFRGTPTLSARLVDTDGGAADILIEDAHLNGDGANRGEYYVAEMAFETDGIYDEVVFEYNATGDNGTNGRFGGAVLTGVVPEPGSLALLGLGGLLIARRRRG